MSWAKSESWMVVFVGRTGCRRPLRRWEDNTTMDLKEMDGKLLTGFIWLTRGVSACNFVQVFGPSVSTKCRKTLD
jgi:hypothetical protein